jgi:hypothetical protein
MKFTLFFLALISLQTFAAPIPDNALPESCKVKDEYTVNKIITDVEQARDFKYNPRWCLSMNGSCINHYPATCSLIQETLTTVDLNSTKKSYVDIKSICREHVGPEVGEADYKCEISAARSISYGGWPGSYCTPDVKTLELALKIKMKGEDLRQAKCQAIVGCLENGLDYWERRTARKWSAYYNCQM